MPARYMRGARGGHSLLTNMLAGRPSASTAVASLVFEAEGRHERSPTQAKAGKQSASPSAINNYDATQSLPWIERSQIMNW